MGGEFTYPEMAPLALTHGHVALSFQGFGGFKGEPKRQPTMLDFVFVVGP